MTIPTIAEKIASIVAEVSLCSRERATQDARLDDLGVESLDLIEIASEIEQTFGIETLDDSALVELQTIGDITRMVESMMVAK